MAGSGPRPVPREEGLENIHFMNGRLVYHLALIKATNASLRDMGRTPETARQATERRLEALKQDFLIFELNEKNEALARQLQTVKLEKEAVFNTAVRVNLKLRRTEAAAEETKSQLDAARLAFARIKTKKRALPGGEQNGYDFSNDTFFAIANAILEDLGRCPTPTSAAVRTRSSSRASSATTARPSNSAMGARLAGHALLAEWSASA